MVVTEDNFRPTLAKLHTEVICSLDTETSGVKIYQEDRLFSIIIATGSEEYYFNFNTEKDHLGNLSPHILPRHYIPEIAKVLQGMSLIFMANAKFDMRMIDKELEAPLLWLRVHDVLVMDRLLMSDQMVVNLKSVAKRNGFEKLDTVEEYIAEHHLWAWEKAPHKKSREKLKFFNLVPFDIISKYALRDARITYDIGIKQLAKLKDYKKSIREGGYDPYQIEIRTTEALYRMEKEGVHLDENYIKEKAAEHTTAFEQAARRFHDETKQVFIDSSKSLSPLFERAGFTPPLTEKGNDSISDEWLESINSPLADIVKTLRFHSKMGGFYKSYLWFRGSDGLLHANVNQAGTRTGRFSMSNPNLQQMPDNEVRRSFIAPPNFSLVSLDFDQQEYRMMLDYAAQTDLIEEVKNGLDVHTATAQLTGVTRQEAKTLNFMLLYGGGVVKLAMALFNVTASEAQLWVIWKMANGWKLDADDKKWEPSITREMREHNLVELRKADELREIYFRDGFHYKSPNGLIQGGASDVCKIALCMIDDLLLNCRSKLLASIHDEIIVKIHDEEKHLIPQIKEIMENAYPHQLLPLTVGVNIGPNLFDMEKYEYSKQKIL